jgi:hypothetical protein
LGSGMSSVSSAPGRGGTGPLLIPLSPPAKEGVLRLLAMVPEELDLVCLCTLALFVEELRLNVVELGAGVEVSELMDSGWMK